MSGLDVPAFAIGLTGLVTLVEKSLAIWKGLAEAQNFGSDMNELTIRLTIEYFRFYDWARASGVYQKEQTSATPSLTRLSGADYHMIPYSPEALIETIVAQFVETLSQISEIREKFETSQTPGPGSPNNSGVSGQSPTAPALGLSFVLPMHGVPHNSNPVISSIWRKENTRALDHETPLYKRFMFTTKPWGVPAKAELEEKISKLCHYNDQLERLLSRTVRSSLEDQSVATHLVLEENEKILDKLMEAANHENGGVRAHAVLFKERQEFQRRRTTDNIGVSKYIRESSTLSELRSQDESGLTLGLFTDKRNDKDNSPVPVAIERYSHGDLGWSNTDFSLAQSRLEELVHLSNMKERPGSLRLLSGVCYIEGGTTLTLVHRIPQDVNVRAQPKSLHTLLSKKGKGFGLPDLDRRMRLAQQLASAISSFGLVRWFHKDFNSRNVVFFMDNSPSGNVLFDMPYIVGLSISRPDSNQERSLNKALNAHTIYLHPDLRVQDVNSRPSYHRKYEMYSLGLVLFEIGQWQTLGSIVSNSDTLEPSKFKEKVVEKCTKNLGFFCGPRYRDAVLRCLTCADDDNGDETKSSVDTLYWSVVLEISKLC